MNFIYISPQFPKTYWNFCDRLKQNGARVLGIGDTPYEALGEEVRNALHEYYRVNNMDDYDEMLRAVAFYTYKYGKIDFLESNNEYWMSQDARLREDFHIPTGYMGNEAFQIQSKAHMKTFYALANIPTPRWHSVTTLESAIKFVRAVSYPVVVKPDVGVGASATYKIKSDRQLIEFFQQLLSVPYIMEEYISGYICSYDGIVNSKKEVLFETSHMFPTPIMDIVNDKDHLVYYSAKHIPEKLRQMGRAAIANFPLKQRFFHFEFFQLLEDKEGLGKKGDYVGLEVNMRPPGGYSVDMMNFANELDVYQIWADMICTDLTTIDVTHRPYICVFASRRDGKQYRHTHREILHIYENYIVMQERMPDILSDAMGNQMYTACFKTQEEVQAFIAFVQEVQGGNENEGRIL